MTKSDYVAKLAAHYARTDLVLLHAPPKQLSAGETGLIDIGRAIRKTLDADPAVQGATHVVIENQISTLASRMKTIQGMIAQYFIMRESAAAPVHLEFVSSHNKLKGYSHLLNGGNRHLANSDDAAASSDNRATSAASSAAPNAATRAAYKTHKADGIRVCEAFFASNAGLAAQWEAAFRASKKRDDLADSFLQGIWYLKSVQQIISHAEDLKINSV